MRPFWLEQALKADASPAPSLSGETRADVCIVGGGFTGLWTAINLKRMKPELDVVIVEADICGAGASGRNGGCVLSWSTKFFTLKRLFGEQEAIRLVRASEDAVAAIETFCRDHHIDAQFRRDGTLYTATCKARCGHDRSGFLSARALNLNSFKPVPADELAQRAGSRKHLAGSFSPHAATVQPALLVRGLRRVAMGMGVRLYEGTPMRRLERGDTPVVEHERALYMRERSWSQSTPGWRGNFRNSNAPSQSYRAIWSSPSRAPSSCADRTDPTRVSVLDSAHSFTTIGRPPMGGSCSGKAATRFRSGAGSFRYSMGLSLSFPARSNAFGFFPAFADVPIAASWNGPSIAR